ncbi:MAG: phosphoribosylformylglycinamidine synthase, partial [Thermoprotei archaeon]
GYVAACHDVSEGGIGVALAEMALSSDFGLEIWLDKVAREGVDRNDYLLFSESNGRFIIEIRREYEEDFLELAQKEGCIISKVGVVTNTRRFQVHDMHNPDNVIIDVHVERLRKMWREGLKL